MMFAGLSRRIILVHNLFLSFFLKKSMIISFYKNVLGGTPGPGQYRLPSEFGYYETALK